MKQVSELALRVFFSIFVSFFSFLGPSFPFASIVASHGFLFLFLFSWFSTLLRVLELAKFMVFEFKWLHFEENFDENDFITCGNSRKFRCIYSISMHGDGCCFEIYGKAAHTHNGCERADDENWGGCCYCSWHVCNMSQCTTSRWKIRTFFGERLPQVSTGRPSGKQEMATKYILRTSMFAQLELLLRSVL